MADKNDFIIELIREVSGKIDALATSVEKKESVQREDLAAIDERVASLEVTRIRFFTFTGLVGFLAGLIPSIPAFFHRNK